MLIFAALAFILIVLFVRRAIPFLLAWVIAWATWSATKNLSLMATTSLATLLVSSWALDAAVGHARTRTIVLAAEVATAALAAGGTAFQAAAASSSYAFWIGLATATAAAAIVAHWRQIAF
ncbi:MAG: hypothetical protein EBZ50_08715 [Alphaproteobacteria bacterium]|nr:hypothetical protein [Alphaproteobacteria bacterium]